MATVALDSSNNVIAISDNGDTWTVQEINDRFASKGSSFVCSSVIAGAPGGLQRLFDDGDIIPSVDVGSKHHKTSGDGTDISHYTAVIDLRPIKKYRYNEINNRTAQLISVGFTYDGSHFSLSSHAQINLEALKNNVALGIFTDEVHFPRGWSTSDDGEYVLTATTDALALYNAGMSYVVTQYDTGRDLRVQVNAATTASAVWAIVDNR